MRETPRRQVLVVGLLLVSAGLGGCLTLDPSITANTTDSTVFESVSTTEWAVSNRVDANVKLTSTVTTTGDVTQLSVIDESGETVSTTMVAAGQTSVMLTLPTNQNVTIVASDTINGTTIETVTVSSEGTKLF